MVNNKYIELFNIYFFKYYLFFCFFKTLINLMNNNQIFNLVKINYEINNFLFILFKKIKIK